MINFKKTALLLLTALLCLTAASCGKEEPGTNPPDTTVSGDNTPGDNSGESSTGDNTPSDAETEKTPSGSDSTDAKETNPSSPDQDKDPVKETTSSTPDPDKPGETGDSEDERLYDYLNGKTVTAAEQARRPVAIMLNNIKDCLPQNSLTAGDIYYEFPVEGGITRIMMLVSDYAKMGVVGSIRSSRDYYLDMLYTHNALYVHAGGSPMAYDKIEAQDIDYLDGVTMYIPDMFYRDENRLTYMASEHTLMTTGQKIVDGIKYKKYETKHDDSFVPTFKFYDEGTDNTPTGNSALHVHMRYTSIQTVDFVYDEDTGEYLRYQYNGIPQVDGLTGEQLSVKNVIVLFTDVAQIPGDDAGRLSVATTGSGQGYYITNGVSQVISWSKESDTAPLVMKLRSGEDLILNSGKTFICVADNSVSKAILFDYKW